MPSLEPVSYNPFEGEPRRAAKPTLTKVDYDPFAGGAPAPRVAQRPSSVTRRVLGDTVGVDLLGKGVVGAGEAAVGLADLATGGYAGKGLEAIGYDPARTRETLESLYSPERQEANRQVQEAEGFVDTTKALLKNPSTIVGAVAESLPSTLGGGGIARKLEGVPRLASRVVRAAIGEGAVSAGQSAEQFRQQSDDGLLSARQGVAAVGSGVGTGALALAGGRVAGELGIGDIDVALAGGAQRVAARPNVLKRTVGGALSEGVLEEMPQSAQEQAFQNFGNERPIAEGVPEAAATGLLTGAAMGGPFAAVSRPNAGAEAGEQRRVASRPRAEPAGPITQSVADVPMAVTEPVAKRHPDAAPGSLSDAANYVPARTAASTTQESVVDNTNAQPAAGQQQHRLPPPPWLSPETGEILQEPDLRAGKAYVHEQLNRMEAAGERPLTRRDWKNELGISDNLLANTILGEVKSERDRGLRAPGEQRHEVIDRLRSAGVEANDEDRQLLGAKETVDPRNAVRLFSEVLGVPQGAASDLVAQIPAENGRRDTVSVLRAAQLELQRRTGAAPATLPRGDLTGNAAFEERDVDTTDFDTGAAEIRMPQVADRAGTLAPASQQQADRQPTPNTLADIPANPASSAEAQLPASDPGRVSSGQPSVTPSEGAAPKSTAPTSDQTLAAGLPASTTTDNGQAGQSASPAALATGQEPPQPLAGTATSGRKSPSPESALAIGTPQAGTEIARKRGPLNVRMGGQEFPVESVEEASQRFLELRDRVGDIGGMRVVELTDQSGKAVGYIDHNGEVYEGDFRASKRGDKPIFDPKTPRRYGADDIEGEATRIAGDVAAAANEAATSPANDLPEPSEAQKEAGNFRVGRLKVNGLDISIEHPAGVKRKAEHSKSLKHAYGYIRRTEGNDGEKVDVFLGDRAADTTLPVFVVDQNHKDGTFDEHKAMMGFGDEAAARKAYLSNYPRGWKGLGGIREMSQEEFKAWVLEPSNTKAPASEPAAAEPPAAGDDEQDLPNDDLKLVKKNPAFRKAMKAIDEDFAGGAKLPPTDGQALEEAAQGWADAKAGRPPKAQRTADLPRGMNPVDFYMSAYAAAKGQDAGAVRMRAAGELYAQFRPTAKPTAGDKVAAGSRQPTTAKATSAAETASVANPARATASEQAIDDFGEVLHGARKHLYADAYRDNLAAAMERDPASGTLIEVWPAPDYAKLIEDGADPWTVAFVRAARDEVPTRPTKSWRVKGWADKVTSLRKFANGLLSGEIEPEALREQLRDPRFQHVHQLVGGRADLYVAVGHDVSLKGVTIQHHNYTLYRGQKDVSLWVVERARKATAFSNWPTELATGKTREEAIEAFKGRAAELKAEQEAKAGKKPEGKDIRFNLYANRLTKKISIGVKIGKGVVTLQDGFDTSREAREYLAEHRDALAEKLAKLRDIPEIRRGTNSPRVGVDHRSGADVNPAQFAETFGFRGVQFGNYVEGPRRQRDLNEAYDALMDLAGVLDIAPRALSLNGELGLAFGARGKGGIRAAAAHFEQATVVINLTKRAGAGSLAHEWFHALDNYFARVRAGGASLAFATDIATNPRDAADPKAMRVEMLQAFQRVMKAIGDTDLPRRSKDMDALRTGKAYWSQGIEMAARSFETYVIAKLADQNGANDYLANVVSEQTFEALGRDDYPYPKADEVPAIRAAFDDFFATVEQREESGRVALFSKAGRVGSDRAAWGDFPAVAIAEPFGPNQRRPSAHPDYAAAKAGDDEAAARLVRDYITKDVVDRFKALIGDRKPTIVPVHAEEATGRNKIPRAFAEGLAQVLGLRVDTGIVQSVRAHHTGAGAYHRIAFQAAFDGPVEQEADYLILDDALTMGGTLANLRGHIEANGGQVLGAGVLTGYSNSANIALQPATAQRLRETFGNDLESYLQDEFGFGIESLTEGEAGQILAARTFDALRDRIAQARRAAELGEASGPLRSQSDRGEVADAPPRAGRSVSGVPIESARALVDELTRGWGDNAPAIRLVTSVDQLPASVRSEPDAERIEGLYEGNPVVWLNLGRIRTEKRFAEVLAHEAIGHYGVERIVGARGWADIVGAIEQLDRSGKATGQLRQIFADVRAKQPAAAADRETFAKEAIAFMAERGIRNSWINRVVNAVRRWLRKMLPSLRWREIDVRGLLDDAEGFLRRSSTPAERRALVRQYSFSRQGTPFYSALVNAVDLAKGAPKKGEAAAWKGWLDGAQRRGEFRQAERDWLDVDGFLDRNGTTTREQLLEYVRANELQVQDVVLAGADTSRAADIQEDEDGGFTVVDEDGAAVAGDAKFQQYTLPGGENYRELLLTLPPRSEAILDPSKSDFDEGQALFGPNDFRSGHFDQPNILAHVRFDERTDADGQRVLFLEEIQSDWHQQGRTQGYTDGKKPFVVFNARTGKEVSEHDTETAARDQVEALGGEFDFAQRHLPGAVPNAPFKNTDEWAMLAFKRMVRWATDQGFDSIAWTTGEQQAERYDLAKRVSEVSYSDDRRLIVRDREGSVIYNETTAEDRIGDVVGKEAAQRLLAARPRDWSSQAGSIGAKARVISGDGLKMGGEGMRAFYDKILPSAVNKWGKRFGAKVGRTSFDTNVSTRLAEVHSLDLTPPMREAAHAGLPLFSKAPAEVLDDVTAVMDANQPENILERARAALRDMVPAKAKDQLRGTWLGALATRHLTELGSDYFQNIKHYSDFLAEMGADRNQLQQEGEAIAEKARKWAGKHRGEARQLFDLMHDATIDGVDPAEAYQPLQFRYGGQLHEATPKKIKEALAAIREQMRGRSGDNKTDMLAEAKTLRGMPAREKRRRQKYPGLVARWNQLSPQAQEIYREFRKAYEDRSAAIEQALVDRIQDTDVPASHKQKIIAVIRQQFETQRLQGVYFPLQRHGRYFVAAEKQDTPVFMMFDRLSELEGAVRDLKKRGFKITAQGLKSAGKAQDAPSGTFVAEVIQSLQKAGVSDKTQDEIYQLYLHTLPELSMRKHAIHRQSVPGFDPDAVRAFAWNMHHGSHQLARLRYGHKLQAVLDLLTQQQNAARSEEDADTRKIAAGDAILQELAKRHEWIMNPQDSQATSLVSSFGFIWYLGLSPAAALVNLTQTALVSFPYLASRHGSIKAMNQLLAGAAASIRTGGNIQRTLTDPDELRAHAYLQRSGALDKSLAHNLAGIAEGGLSGYNPAWAKAMEIIGWGFHKAEVVNREATGLAAFRMAKAGGASFEAAVRAAVDAINDTHFDYTNQNRARFMQSGTAKVLLMFRQYSLNMTWHLGRMVWQATKGQEPEVRKLARRNLAGVLGMSALFSGALGLPMMSVVMGVLNAVASSAGDDDEPWDAETEFRAFLADMFGPDVASLILSGAVNATTGADLASRVSLSQLWFRDADRELDGRGRYYALLEQAAGPMGGVLKNALVGKQLMDEGHLWRGVETTLPKSLKDMMRAARYAQEGVNTLRGDPLVDDASLRDTLLQLSGFTPAKVADRYDRNRALKNYEQMLLERRGRLMDAFAMARRLGDGEASRETMEQIRAFNRKNPEIAITRASLRRSLAQRARYSQRAEHGITLDRRLARRVREEVGD